MSEAISTNYFVRPSVCMSDMKTIKPVIEVELEIAKNGGDDGSVLRLKITTCIENHDGFLRAAADVTDLE